MAIAPKFEANISADISKFMRNMATVDKRIKELASGVTVDIKADISGFMQRAATVQTTIETIANSNPTVTVDANTAGFVAQAATVEAVAAAVGSLEPTVTVEADTAAATAQVTGFMAVLRAITAQNLVVRIRASWANYQSVMGAMAAFSRNFSEIIGMVGRGITIAMSPAIVPVLASVVGLLGNLGPMLGTIAGSTFALGSAFGTAGIGAAAFGAIAVTNLKDIFGASEELKKLNEKMAKADTGKERAEILKEIARVQGSLNKEQTKGLEAMNKLKDTWGGIAGSLQSKTIEIFTKALGILNGVLVTLKPMFTTVMDAADGLIDSLGKAIDSKPMQAFFEYLNTSAAPIMATITEAVGYFIQGFLNMMTAFGPLASETADGFRNMGKGFAEWADGLSKSEKFQSFVSYVSENMPKIRSIFSDAIQGMINMFGGFGGSSSDMMTSLQNMMERFKNFSSTISENQGFQKFIDYIKTNGPVVVSAIGEIITLITNLGIAAAPMGEKMLGMIEGMTNFANEMLKAHPWLGKLAVGAVVLGGAFLAALPILVGLNALLGGFITKMILATAKTIWAATVQVAKWILMGVTATINAIKMAAAWTLATGIAMVKAVAGMIASAAIFVARWVLMGAQALIHAARVAAAWLLSTGAAMAVAVAGMIATSAVFVAKWTWMAVQALFQAARMAAAWFIALGPIGWVAGAIIGLVALVILNWDKVSAWTSKAWSATAKFVTDAVSKIAGWIQQKFPALYNVIATYMTSAKTIIVAVWNYIKGTFTNVLSFLKALVKGDFQGMKTAIQNQMELAKSTILRIWGAIKSYLLTLLSTLVTKFQEMFGKIVTKIREKMGDAVKAVAEFIGKMPSTITGFIGEMISAGASLVGGVIEGIKSKISEGLGVIGGLASSLISRFKKDTDTHSPSRAFADVAKWFAPGIVKGLESTSGQALAAVTSLSNNLTNAFNPQLAMADMRASAQLDTSINRADMGVVRKSFAAEIDSGEKQEQAIYVNNEIVGDKILTVVNRGQAKQSRLTDGFYGK